MSSTSTVAPGSLLLYSSSGRLYERAIAFADHGPFVHVAIMLSGQRIIEATGKGVMLNHFRQRTQETEVVPMEQYATAEGIARALVWVIQQQGKQYGWLDIAFQGAKFLWPNNPFQLTQKDHWDCSDLATRFCQEAGILFPDGWENPYSNTPNDLARLFGLLPPRAGHALALIPPRITEKLSNNSSA